MSLEPPHGAAAGGRAPRRLDPGRLLRRGVPVRSATASTRPAGAGRPGAGALCGHLQQELLFGPLRLAYLVLPRPDGGRSARAGPRSMAQQPVPAGGHGGFHPGRALRHPPAPEPPRLPEPAGPAAGGTGRALSRPHPIHSGAGLQCAVQLPRRRGALDRDRQHQGAGAAPCTSSTSPPPEREGWLLGFASLRQPDPAPTMSPPGQLMRSV